jgi:phenylalanyl-tRNA synthetase beta chain
MTDVYPARIEPQRIALRAQRTRALLGLDVPTGRQEELLAALGLEVQRAGDTLHTRVPTRRPDLTREVDLIEEVARLEGYDRAPATIPSLRAAPGRSGDELRTRAADALRGLGFDEIVTYAFISRAANAAIDSDAKPLTIANPIREEQAAMRTSLVPGLLAALERNLARGVDDVKLFELGEVFIPTSAQLPDERRRVAGLLAGRSDGWLKTGARFDFFDANGAVGELLAALGHRADFVPSRRAWLHPGVQAAIVVGDREVGVVGELHPDLGRGFVFEIDLATLGRAPAPRIEEPPRFPQVVRDLSFFVAAEKSAREISALFDEIKDPLCVAVDVLEDYREAGRVPAGQKGMLWSFTYRAADRTLTDAEVQAAHERLLSRLRERLPVTPR